MSNLNDNQFDSLDDLKLEPISIHNPFGDFYGWLPFRENIDPLMKLPNIQDSFINVKDINPNIIDSTNNSMTNPNPNNINNGMINPNTNNMNNNMLNPNTSNMNSGMINPNTGNMNSGMINPNAGNMNNNMLNPNTGNINSGMINPNTNNMNINFKNINPIPESQLNAYPDETLSDELFSYNKFNLKNQNMRNYFTPSDILKELGDSFYSMDFRDKNSSANEIYNSLLKDFPELVVVMQKLGIPTPIAKVYILNIINYTLNYKVKEEVK